MLTVAAAWTVVVLASLVDVGNQNQLWMSVTAYDHGLRTAFVDAVLRTGLPPVDPVYWPGHDAPMRYYYFWYAVCASVARLAHISARQVLIASCVWPALGVVAMLALFARYVLGCRGRDLNRTVAMATALLGVCGLDILVTGLLRLLHTPTLADMEWWAIDHVASWPDTFLWVPHHAAALVTALLGLLLILQASAPANGTRERLKLSILAGLSLAAAFGMSVYLAVAMVLILAVWLVAGFWNRTRWRVLAIAALTSAITLSRFLWQLTRHDGTTGAAEVSGRATSPLYFGVREILTPAFLARASFVHSLSLRHPWRARELAAAILLLPGWGIELGFYAVVLLIALARFRRASSGERTLLGFTLSGLAAASFLRSGVISTNDYGIRAALLPQFFLLLQGAVVFASSKGGTRLFLWLLILVGGAGCTYQLILLRIYLPYQQTHGNPAVRDIGERAYALHEAYAALDAAAPAHARIQFDPAAKSFYLYPHLLFANRQLITAEISCSTSFGGDPAACPGIQNGINALFPGDPAATPSAVQARQLCGLIGAQYLVVTRWDNVWQAREGWPWTLPAAVAQPAVRILSCN